MVKGSVSQKVQSGRRSVVKILQSGAKFDSQNRDDDGYENVIPYFQATDDHVEGRDTHRGTVSCGIGGTKGATVNIGRELISTTALHDISNIAVTRKWNFIAAKHGCCTGHMVAEMAKAIGIREALSWLKDYWIIMDQRERKEHPSLPPDYVSLAQLQERWLRKQKEKELKEKQEKEKIERDAATQNENQNRKGFKNEKEKELKEKQEKEKIERDAATQNENQNRKGFKNEKEKELKEKQEKEKKERDAATQNENQNRKGFKNDGRGKMDEKPLSDVPWRRVEKHDAIEDKGKGKEIVIGDFENGDENKKDTKKKKNRHSSKKKYALNGEKEKLKSEIKVSEGGDGSEEVKIVPQNEVKVGNQSGINGGLKGINEIASVNRRDFRGGFRRNGDNQGSGYKSKKDNRVRLNQLKETEVRFAVDKKGYSKEWRQRRRNDNNGECCYKLNENEPDVLKGNVVEPESEKKAEDSNLEICSEKGGFNGRDRNKTKEHRVERKGLNDNIAALEKKVDEEVLVVESSKNGEKGGIGNGYRRYGNSRGTMEEDLGI
ncbi:hypothetical protein DH2020_003979 [Rehmannia glutinosa]|uniref:Uncharacterized protein n=1 Tax=Rehmannia glutinosa TaxID=99300 RepID=A0ABR0XN91_REHGL